ncbi:hypothetical protein GWI33_016482 [Rhynchophorus ferrugineus]|uniref:Uncharacterized protein n=1 Tax=Rhynchophorus ferrugineus TaxID=354439 RepID=A0A834I1P3_RHYFE|nr:hypothetical protein GWI33_016482 [Rhynchophorus ferrugineus]
MLKEHSLWPPDWWATRCGPPQVGGKQVARPLKSLYGDCRPQVDGTLVARPSGRRHACCGPLEEASR